MKEENRVINSVVEKLFNTIEYQLAITIFRKQGIWGSFPPLSDKGYIWQRYDNSIFNICSSEIRNMTRFCTLITHIWHCTQIPKQCSKAKKRCKRYKLERHK